MSSRPALNILYVEDAAEVRELSRELFELLGHVVEPVGSAEAALLWLDANAADVMIADVSLPGLNGIELLRQARLRWPAMHLVLSSGYSHSLRPDQFGFQVFMLPKPFDLDDLDALFRVLIARSGRA